MEEHLSQPKVIDIVGKHQVRSFALRQGVW